MSNARAAMFLMVSMGSSRAGSADGGVVGRRQGRSALAWGQGLRQQGGHGELVVAKVPGGHGLHLLWRDAAQQGQQALLGVWRKSLRPVAAQFLRLADHRVALV